MNSGKGVEQLLEAWIRVSEDRRNGSTLLLVGDGPQREQLTELARRHNLDEVRFAGHLPPEEVAQCMAASDVFVFPTLQDVWGLVANEAMAVGLPILCSRFAGCHDDLVEPGINGHVFDLQDIDCTAELLSRTIDEEDRLPERGDASRQIISRFTISRSANSFLELARALG